MQIETYSVGLINFFHSNPMICEYIKCVDTHTYSESVGIQNPDFFFKVLDSKHWATELPPVIEVYFRAAIILQILKNNHLVPFSILLFLCSSKLCSSSIFIFLVCTSFVCSKFFLCFICLLLLSLFVKRALIYSYSSEEI